MSITLADAPPDSFFGREDDIDEPPYLWSDLQARRCALGLQTEELSPVLGMDPTEYRARESGDLDVEPHLLMELIGMERFVAHIEQELLGSASAEAVNVLAALDDQEAFEVAYPDACTRGEGLAYPVSLQHVAVGRVAAELTRQGGVVEVHRGERRADLRVRRLAAGLLKEETSQLLGIVARRYARFESSPTAPPAGLIAELQAVDDFIVNSAAQLEVIEEDDVTIVVMIADEEFERVYPQARTRRDAVFYPRRVHRVAVGRRASALDVAGAVARIGVLED
ncbi:hypothetical protein FIV07_28220 (plasmid) [Mycobacterium sp. THAF192]|nr:hypothetical protein FIV07_28220 [Mycobacterium sp. THAF192]